MVCAGFFGKNLSPYRRVSMVNSEWKMSVANAPVTKLSDFLEIDLTSCNAMVIEQ